MQGLIIKKIKIYQKTRGKLLISSLEIKTPMSEISQFRNTCFSNEKILHKLQKWFAKYKTHVSKTKEERAYLV